MKLPSWHLLPNPAITWTRRRRSSGMPRSRGGPLKSQVSIVVHFKIHRWVNEREKEYIGECKKKKKKKQLSET